MAVSASRIIPGNAGRSVHAVPVAAVDDDENQQLLIKDILEHSRHFLCVGCFSSGEEALSGFHDSRAKLVLMDLRLPGMSGLECAKRVKRVAPALKIVAITGFASEAGLDQALHLEFSGFLTKPLSRRELMDALTVAVDGGVYLSAGLRQFFHGESANAQPRASTADALALTPREWEVMNLLRRGLEYKEIADRLNISSYTVNNHLAHIRERLGVHNAIEAINKVFPRRE